MFNCLYCGLDKSTSELSLEHAIPQFMGGDFAPIKYRLSDNVCKTCNNRLGLFVDASYAKSWTVTNNLASASKALYTGLLDRPIHLSCIGTINIDGLVVPDNYLIEYWVGPSGESVIWVRSNDERMYWYAGGNPIDSRKKFSTVYISFTSDDPIRYQMCLSSFNDAFKNKNARKIMCNKLSGAPDGTILSGFDSPTLDEKENIIAIQNALNSGERLKGQIIFNTKFDLRFISKMVLGIGYAMFGDAFLGTTQAIEARKGCWPRQDELPDLRGTPSFNNESGIFSQNMGYPGAVAITIMVSGSSYAMCFTINQEMPFVVELAPLKLTSPHIVKPESGFVILLFPSIKQAIELTLVDMITHACGYNIHPELEKIDAKRKESEEFHSQLTSI